MFTLEEIQDSIRFHCMLWDELVPWEIIKVKEDFILLLYKKHLPVINHLIKKDGVIVFHPTRGSEDNRTCVYCSNTPVPEEFILSAKLINNYD